MVVSVVSPQQWVTAFVIALAGHLLAGALLWMVHNAPDAPRYSPRGVMVSLDALSVGNSLQPSSVPEPVTPAQPPVAEPVPVATPQPPGPVSPTPVPAVPAITQPAASDTVQPSPAGGAGAIQSASGVAIPVANVVTIKAADTLEAIEEVPAITAEAAKAADTTAATNQGSGAHGLSQDPTLSYIAHIRNWLGQHKYYPVAARRSGAEGTVRLYLVVASDGRVLNVSVARSSGSPALDQAAMDMVKRAEPLPPMPENLFRTRLEIILPVNFTLGQ